MLFKKNFKISSKPAYFEQSPSAALEPTHSAIRSKRGNWHAAQAANTDDAGGDDDSATANVSNHIAHNFAAQGGILQRSAIVGHGVELEGLGEVAVLLLVGLQYLTEILEALLAVFVEIFNQALFFYNLRHILTKCLLGPGILREPIVALDNVLQQPSRRLVFYLSQHHVVEDCGDGEESLGGLAQVIEPRVVQQYLLYDESRNGLTELGTTLHYAKAERYDLCLQQEADDFGVVNFDEGAYHAQRSQPQVLKTPSFADCVQERIQEQWDVRLQEQLPRVLVRRHTL